jgi:hypothetical protein
MPDSSGVDLLLPKRFVFRFSLPCLYRDPLWTAKGAALAEEHKLVDLTALEGGADGFADVRAAWSENGLAFAVRVSGKKKTPWCRATKPDESDGLRVWIDTRDVHNVHRATRFCHEFIFLPSGDGKKLEDPVVQWMPINRARQHPKAIPPGLLQVRSEKRVDGYVLEALIGAAALTGFDPDEHPRLGFNYAAVDRELGVQTLSPGEPMPYEEDVSLWATLELQQKH